MKRHILTAPAGKNNFSNEEILKSGVPGFDDMFAKKGVKPGSVVLVSGGPGTGKSAFLWQFVTGVMHDKDEVGVLVTIEESLKGVKQNAKSIGIDLEALERTGKLILIENPVLSKSIFGSQDILAQVRKNNVKRVAIDSLNMFKYFYPPGTLEYRNELLKFMREIKKSGITLFCTSERTDHCGVEEIEYEPEDFIFDGLVQLGRIRKGSDYERVLSITKMRGQEHLLKIVPMKISGSGVEIYPNETPFALLEDDEKKSKK